MSDAKEPVTREGRVSRGPLLFALGVLILVAVIGTIVSTSARNDEDEADMAVTPPVTAEISTTEYPSLDPTVTTQTETLQAGSEGSSADPGGCTPAALLSAVDSSGQAADGVVDSATVTRFNCIDDYAYTRLTAPGLDEAEAYFEKSDGAWTLLVLGTAIDPEAQGIPADTVRQLAAD